VEEDRTSSFPTLKLLAETLVNKLTSLDSAEATSVRRQLQEIIHDLGTWANGDKTPDDIERKVLINHLVDLNRRAHQVLGREMHEADTLRPPPDDGDFPPTIRMPPLRPLPDDTEN